MIWLVGTLYIYPFSPSSSFLYQLQSRLNFYCALSYTSKWREVYQLWFDEDHSETPYKLALETRQHMALRALFHGEEELAWQAVENIECNYLR